MIYYLQRNLEPFFMEDDEEIWPPREPLPTLEDIKNMKIEKQKYLQKYNFPFCENVTRFDSLIKVGQGTYG